MSRLPIVRWTDLGGVLRCSHWPHSHEPRVATTLEANGLVTVIGDLDLAKRAEARRERQARAQG